MAFSHPCKLLVDTRKVAQLSVAHARPSDTDELAGDHDLSIEHRVLLQMATSGGGDEQLPALFREVAGLKKKNSNLENANNDLKKKNSNLEANMRSMKEGAKRVEREA